MSVVEGIGRSSMTQKQCENLEKFVGGSLLITPYSFARARRGEG